MKKYRLEIFACLFHACNLEVLVFCFGLAHLRLFWLDLTIKSWQIQDRYSTKRRRKCSNPRIATKKKGGIYLHILLSTGYSERFIYFSFGILDI